MQNEEMGKELFGKEYVCYYDLYIFHYCMGPRNAIKGMSTGYVNGGQ